MDTGRYYTPTDIDRLRMENELLALENRYLKCRLRHQCSENRTTAEEDVALLLRRLAGTPLVYVLRLKRGYRELEHRYLE